MSPPDHEPGESSEVGAPAEDPETRERRLKGIRQRAAELDGKPFLVGTLRELRRRLPGDDAFGDPLSTAGDEPVHAAGRSVTSLSPNRPSAAQELGLGALQVWQSLSERAGRGRGTVDVAMLFTDLVGFSDWSLEAGDEAAVLLLRDVGHAVEGAVAAHGGRVIKRLGDGVMAAFGGVEAAVGAALDGHDALKSVEIAGHRPVMRAGVHVGRPRELGGDLLGVDVNIAARVGEAAKGGEVLVSEFACEALGDAFALSKPKRLKAAGVPREMRVCKVTRSP